MFAYLAAVDGVDSGFAVVTDRFVCLLGSETSIGAARALYAALESNPVHIDDVLDSIVARHGLEHFGIVEMLDAEERSMNIAVRGSVTVDLDGSTTTRLSGPTGATWITGSARGVSSLSLALDTGGSDAESLPIRRGVVRAHSIAIDEGSEDAASPTIADESTLLTVPIDLSSIREAVEAAGVAAEVRPERKRKSTQKPVDLAVAVAESVVVAESVAVAEPIPVLESAPVVVANPPLRVRLPDGNLLDAATPIVVGRRPWSTESDTRSAVHVAVPSPLREVSATHLEVAEVDGALTARDLGSTNGTIVLSTDRAPRLLEQRRSTSLVDGDVLDVGEGFRLLITSARD